MTWQYYIWPGQDESDRSWHANTITKVTEDSITVIQGSLADNEATEISQKEYNRSDNGKVNPGILTGPFIKSVKARRWNFNYFDSKGR